MIVDEAKVAEYLAASRRAHLLYLQYKPRMASVPGQGVVKQPGDAAECQRYLKEAASNRVQAQTIDPDHIAPAWMDESSTHPHDELMLDYLRALTK